MKAIGFNQPLPISDERSLVDIELPDPEPGPNDLLVAVEAIAVNPVDTKVRASARPAAGSWRILGWDAVGTVRAVGRDVSGFRVGDRVFHAGAINRPGCYAQLQAVDARIAAHVPEGLSNEDAAALPLTTLTGWETLFDRLDVQRPVTGAAPALLVIGGAGGVGAITIQLARALTGLTVIATASNPRFTVSRVDIDRGGTTYTIDTLHDIAAEYPGAELYFITGADALAQILTWKDSEEIFDLAHLVGVTRPGHVLSDSGVPRERISLVEVPAMAISSTDCRQRVGEGSPVWYLVPDGVVQYIRKYGLYRMALRPASATSMTARVAREQSLRKENDGEH